MTDDFSFSFSIQSNPVNGVRFVLLVLNLLGSKDFSVKCFV